MNYPSLLALGYSEAAMWLRGAGAKDAGAIISIYGRHEQAVEAPEGVPVLALRFDDAEVVDFRDRAAANRAWALSKWASETGRPLTPPTIENAKAIIDFARANLQIEGTMLCQCQAGMSRSTAAALLCLAAWTQAGDEAKCVTELLRIRPSAVPLMSLLRLGDEVLGRGGSLVKAMAESRNAK